MSMYLKGDRLQWKDTDLSDRVMSMYKAMFGTFAPITHAVSGRPVELSVAQWLERLECMCEALGLPREKATAIDQQLGWAFTNQDSKAVSKVSNAPEMIIRLRAAAIKYKAISPEYALRLTAINFGS